MLHAFRDDERRRITVTASGVVSFLDLATFKRRFPDEGIVDISCGASVVSFQRTPSGRTIALALQTGYLCLSLKV